MNEIFSRNELFWGKKAQDLLATKHVAVFGLGGVGGFCAEALARAGIGELTIVDFDKVSPSNINRQIVALNSTIGQDKTKLFEQRLKDINPDLKINVINDFYTIKLNTILLSCPPPYPPPLRGRVKPTFDFFVEAIDTMRAKIDLIEFGYKHKIPLISSFGAGNRIAPEKLYICDISEIKDKDAPFITTLLHQLKKKGITKGIAVVASEEKPFAVEKITVVEKIHPKDSEKIEFSKIITASTPFVASCAGIFMASFIVRKLITL